MDKITIFLKYTGPLAFTSCSQAIDSLFSVPGAVEWGNRFSSIGKIDAPASDLEYVRLWWQPEDRTFKLSWYSSDSENSVLEYLSITTSEQIDIFKAHGWEPLVPVSIEHNNYAGKHKDRFFNKFEIFDSVSKDAFGDKSLDFPDGKYTVSNQTMTCWSHDGNIISINSDTPLAEWTRNYDIHKYGPLRIAHLTWCGYYNLTIGVTEKSFFYYEMSHPNNEIGVSFQEELDHNLITVNDDFIKEFIDQIYYTCPHIKKVRSDYVQWPVTPFTFNNRFRDSKGYYFVFFAENWTNDHSQWTNNQVGYLKDFLDRTSKYTGDKDSILAYAREKWTIQ